MKNMIMGPGERFMWSSVLITVIILGDMWVRHTGTGGAGVTDAAVFRLVLVSVRHRGVILHLGMALVTLTAASIVGLSLKQVGCRGVNSRTI